MMQTVNDIQESRIDENLLLNEECDKSNNHVNKKNKKKNKNNNSVYKKFNESVSKSNENNDNQNIEENDNKKISINKTLKTNYFCICIFAFLTGTDFAVIIPTLWDRLSLDFNSSGFFMGVVMSSYSFTGVICGLIMGKLSDDRKKVKPFFLFAISFSILGHIMYFIGFSKYLILLARAISGICIGASTVALAFIAKTTNNAQRTSIISIVMACRQIGLMFGPAFNILLRKFNFYLFEKILVDRKSAPGLFMAALWSLFLFILFLIFKEIQFGSNQKIFKDENESINNNNNNDIKKNNYKKEFFRWEILILLAITFFTYFNQTSLETIVIPFTEFMFGWNELHNSILFCCGGCVIIISYIMIRLLTKKLKDKVILLIGILSISFGLIIACSCLPFAKQFTLTNISLYKLKTNVSNSSINFNETIYKTKISNISISNLFNKTILTKDVNNFYDYQFLPAFFIFVVLDVVGLPAIAICSSSLFTKLIDNKVQGFGQGIQRGILGLGTILGPLCAGPFIYKPIILLAITLTFILIILLLVVVFFKLLDSFDSKSNNSN